MRQPSAGSIEGEESMLSAHGMWTKLPCRQRSRQWPTPSSCCPGCWTCACQPPGQHTAHAAITYVQVITPCHHALCTEDDATCTNFFMCRILDLRLDASEPVCRACCPHCGRLQASGEQLLSQFQVQPDISLTGFAPSGLTASWRKPAHLSGHSCCVQECSAPAAGQPG